MWKFSFEFFCGIASNNNSKNIEPKDDNKSIYLFRMLSWNKF